MAMIGIASSAKSPRAFLIIDPSPSIGLGSVESLPLTFSGGNELTPANCCFNVYARQPPIRIFARRRAIRNQFYTGGPKYVSRTPDSIAAVTCSCCALLSNRFRHFGAAHAGAA